MNKKISLLKATLSVAVIAAASPTLARDLPVPHGRYTEALAGACGIGPFPQTGKAGKYNMFCDELTDAEKCLAIVKRNILHDGTVRKERVAAKAEYCLDLFEKELL